MILVTRVYGIKCTVVSQESTYMYVQSSLHDHKELGWALFQVFMHCFILSHTLTHTNSHSHIPTGNSNSWFRPATMWWLPCQRGKHQHWWYGETSYWCWGTWWCHHVVTRDSDVLFLWPDPTHWQFLDLLQIWEWANKLFPSSPEKPWELRMCKQCVPGASSDFVYPIWFLDLVSFVNRLCVGEQLGTSCTTDHTDAGISCLWFP